MRDDRPPLKDGYEYTGRGLEIRLIDPVDCPRGHRYAFGQRTHSPCSEHHGHPSWWCACGAQIYRHDGEFFSRLPCR